MIRNQHIGMLPNTIFFDPRKRFIDKLADYAGDRGIVDCGAGAGRVGRLLSARNVKVLSLDLYKREAPESEIMIYDATRFPFAANCIALIARPCRGFWIQDTIERALFRGSEVIYVGLPKHIPYDIDSSYSTELLCRHAGKDNELAYIVRNAQ